MVIMDALQVLYPLQTIVKAIHFEESSLRMLRASMKPKKSSWRLSTSSRHAFPGLWSVLDLVCSAEELADSIVFRLIQPFSN